MANKSGSVINLSGRLSTEINNQTTSELVNVSRRLLQLDHTIWGAGTEAINRLGWVNLPKTSRELLPTLDALSAWSRANGISNFVLCGMGGSSLGPEVIAKSHNKPLSVLDSTDPSQIKSMVPQNSAELAKTLFIVSSKSGSTIETLSQFDYIKALLDSHQIPLSNHFVIVTDPNSPLSEQAKKLNLKTVIANPEVGGRFSVLSAFGLVPAALIGVDVATLLDDAEEASDSFARSDSAAVKLAVALYKNTNLCFTVSEQGSDLKGFSDWLEQLVAESTGKNGTGRLPVVLENFSQGKFGISISTANKPIDSQLADLVITAPLGAAFFLWEFATALLGYLLKVDPFSQPNVAEAKQQTSLALTKAVNPPELRFSGKSIQLFSKSQISKLKEIAILNFEYISVMAYVARKYDQELFQFQSALIKNTNRPVTVGYGPRFLHSTGQFHKGGPQTGLFIQLISEKNSANFDVAIPEKSYGFAKLIAAQASGDRLAIEDRNLPILIIEFAEFKAAVAELIKELN